MKLSMRPYRDDSDFWRIRAFLRQVFVLNDRRGWSWQADRFDYWRWHGAENMGHGPLEEKVALWEDTDGRIVAVLNSEDPGHAHLQLHPDHGTPELQAAMVNVAEQKLVVPAADGRRRLVVWAHSSDAQRQEILAGRGYSRAARTEYQRWRTLDAPLPEAPLPDGFLVRALRGVDEFPARSYLSWQAFHPDQPDSDYKGWEWYANIQRAPLYRRQLDLVAVAPDGEFASFCTVWFDDVTRTGAFEPVGTAPAYQRRGLARAVIVEGLRRLRALGATLAFIGSSEEAAHNLYASVGFTDYLLYVPWVQRW
jgi:mycothiol synthase